MVVISLIEDVTIALLIGVVICFILYIYNSAHSDYISMESDNSTVTSNILQTIDKDLFKHSKQVIKVFKLAGYIFFAPSYEIKEKILKQVKMFNSMNYKQITYVIVDFTICTGVDSTATGVIVDMVEKLADMKVHTGLVFANIKRRLEFTKQLKLRKTLKEKANYYSIYGTLEQALGDCELQIDIPLVLTPRSPISASFQNRYLNELHQFLLMLKKIKDKNTRHAVIRCFQLGVGKIVFIPKSELLYHEFERSDGVYFLMNGRLTAIILDTINERVSVFNRQNDDTKDLKRLWSINESGSLLGNMLERKGISYTTETIIADCDSYLYQINEENLYKLEKLDDKTYTTLSQWEADLRYRKIKYLISRVQMSRQYILS